MTPLDWPRVSTLPWRERNALVEAAIREYLSEAVESYCASSSYLAGGLMPGYPTIEYRQREWEHDHARLAKLLARLAPHIGPPLATHDGVTVTRNGKTWRRWRWHGQRRES